MKAEQLARLQAEQAAKLKKREEEMLGIDTDDEDDTEQERETIVIKEQVT